MRREGTKKNNIKSDMSGEHAVVEVLGKVRGVQIHDPDLGAHGKGANNLRHVEVRWPSGRLSYRPLRHHRCQRAKTTRQTSWTRRPMRH